MIQIRDSEYRDLWLVLDQIEAVTTITHGFEKWSQIVMISGRTYDSPDNPTKLAVRISDIKLSNEKGIRQ